MAGGLCCGYGTRAAPATTSQLMDVHRARKAVHGFFQSRTAMRETTETYLQTFLNVLHEQRTGAPSLKQICLRADLGIPSRLLRFSPTTSHASRLFSAIFSGREQIGAIHLPVAGINMDIKWLKVIPFSCKETFHSRGR